LGSDVGELGTILVESAIAGCTDPPSPAQAFDPTAAAHLFVEAKELMNAGQTAEACEKLEASLALDPGGGTLMQLAYCREVEGKLARSHARYQEALALAEREGNVRRVALAREHLAALGPRLGRMEIRVGPGVRALAGLEIRRDGQCVPASS